MPTTALITKKIRRKLRSRKYHDMKPHIFDKLVCYLPHVLDGIVIPKHNEAAELETEQGVEI